MAKTKTAVMVLLLCGWTSGRAGGQTVEPPAATNRAAAQPAVTRSGDVTSIDPTLKGNDDFEVLQALNSALGFLTDVKNGPRAIERLPGWLHTLIGEKRFDDVEQFTLAVINSHPTDLHLIEVCQQVRIRAKLLQHKPQDALPLAKGLYNVCAMPDTSKAIQLVAECLYDISADGDPAAAVKQFKLEQIHGAAATQPTRGDSNTLRQIKIDTKQYAAGLERADQVEDGWTASIGRGNLLLLSGLAKEASKAFGKAYSLASDGNLATSAEAVARAMRAEDGSVGRANAWILSLRPTEQATQ